VGATGAGVTYVPFVATATAPRLTWRGPHEARSCWAFSVFISMTKQPKLDANEAELITRNSYECLMYLAAGEYNQVLELERMFSEGRDTRTELYA
jgi:hypothetical protein